MNCAECGFENIPVGANYCPKCGQRIYRIDGIDYTELVVERTQEFTGREWVFDTMGDWLADPEGSRVFLLAGSPGTGKTAIAARLVQMSEGDTPVGDDPHLDQGSLTFYQFCQAFHNDTLDPLRFTKALSLRLARQYPPFAEALTRIGTQDPRIHVETRQEVGTARDQALILGALVVVENLTIGDLSARVAFDRVVAAPLKQLCQTDEVGTILILVDALDEALTYPGETLVDLLGHVLDDPRDLPPQVRFLLTSRPDDRVTHLLGQPTLDLIRDAPPDVDDVRLYAHRRLAALNEPRRSELASHIAKASKGIFLYARYVIDDLPPDLDQVEDVTELPLPEDLHDVCRRFLRRELARSLDTWDDDYAPLLGTVAVARGEGLTLDQLAGATRLPKSKMRKLLRTCGQYLAGPEPDGPFRIYHQSFREFLLEDKEYPVYPDEQNQAIAEHFLRLYGGDWQSCQDDYALLYTPMHLTEAVRGAPPKDRQKRAKILHDLVQDGDFSQAKLRTFPDPGVLLGDLQLAVGVALEDDDLAHIWQHMLRYRQIIREERTTDKTFNEVWSGQYELALDRTALYSYMPNSQAMIRLWIAWVAASDSNADKKLATQAAQRALADLPPLDTLAGEGGEEDADERYLTRDAATEAICRLLIRTAWKAQESEKAQQAWLAQVIKACQPENVKPIQEKLAQLWTDWDQGFPGPTGKSVWVPLIVDRLEADLLLKDPTRYREATMIYRDELAQGIAQTRQDPMWQSYVSRTVALVALDDYPSYRERALAWLTCAVLMQESDESAQQAMCHVLSAALDKPEPTFGDDVPAAVLHAAAHTRGRMLSGEKLFEFMSHVPDYEWTPDPTQLGGGWGDIRYDPWAQERRWRSAHAAVLWRLGGTKQAEQELGWAGIQDHSRGYAGYRTLARLSLAWRWLEWGDADKAGLEIMLAGQDASHMIDTALRQERVGLVEAAEGWLRSYRAGAEVWSDVDACLRRVGELSGMVRSTYLQFLSAIWSQSADRLRRLVALGLDDRTASDAILGRLVGALVKEEALSPAQVNRLLETMKLVELVERVLTEGGVG